MTSFSKEDEEKLINIVAKNPVLYDKSHGSYRDNLVKDKVWRAIGKEVKRNSEDCKTKWKFIRDGYKRFKKNHTLGIGSTAAKHSKQKRHQLLLFLDDVPEHRSGSSNLPPSPEGLEINEEIEETKDQLILKEQDASNDDEPPYTEHNSDKEEAIEVEMKRRLKQESILHHFKQRDEQRIPAKKADDDIELFVRYMGEVLRSLPPVEKAQAKKQLHAVLSDYEIMAATYLSGRIDY
nr:transcription factor Adf-1-like [Onthophagus taurus]